MPLYSLSAQLISYPGSYRNVESHTTIIQDYQECENDFDARVKLDMIISRKIGEFEAKGFRVSTEWKNVVSL